MPATPTQSTSLLAPKKPIQMSFFKIASSTTTSLMLADETIPMPAITAFLDNFNYLDANGHRKGSFFSSIGLNKELTLRIESAAKVLQDTLSQLSENSDHVLFIEFLNTVKTALAAVQQARLDHGLSSFYNPGEPAPTIYDLFEIPATISIFDENTQEYKTPVPAGKFEANLIKGLTAAVPHLTNIEKKVSLEALIKTVENYSPTPVLIEHNSAASKQP